MTKQGCAEQALEHYQHASTILFSPDIEFKLGYLFKRRLQFDSALIHFRNIHYLSPSKFRPLYQIAKIYDQQGNSDATDSLARTIIRKTPKVNSAEVIMMKEEMRVLVRENETTRF